jgi:hypothetical protein
MPTMDELQHLTTHFTKSLEREQATKEEYNGLLQRQTALVYQYYEAHQCNQQMDTVCQLTFNMNQKVIDDMQSTKNKYFDLMTTYFNEIAIIGNQITEEQKKLEQFEYMRQQILLIDQNKQHLEATNFLNQTLIGSIMSDLRDKALVDFTYEIKDNILDVYFSPFRFGDNIYRNGSLIGTLCSAPYAQYHRDNRDVMYCFDEVSHRCNKYISKCVYSLNGIKNVFQYGVDKVTIHIFEINMAYYRLADQSIIMCNVKRYYGRQNHYNIQRWKNMLGDCKFNDREMVIGLFNDTL